MDGNNLFRLIVQSQDWVHRRVDKIHLTSAGRIRRLVSVDFTAPSKYAIKVPRAKCIVPVGVLTKQPQRAFDVTSASGSSLPVLNTAQHAEFVVPLLFSALEACGVEFKIKYPCAKELITKLVITYDLQKAAAAESKLLESLNFEQVDVQLEAFARKIIRTLRNSYLLLVELDRHTLGRRTLVKYSYDEEELPKRGPKRKYDASYRYFNEVVIDQTVPDPGFAKSQHLELWVPDDVELGDSMLAWRHTWKSKPFHAFESERRGQRIAHISTSQIDRFCEARVFYIVRPIKYGLCAVALIALIALIVAVVIARLAMHLPPNSLLGDWTIPSPAASIMLIAPAILLSWLARPPENSVVFQALLPVRWLIGLIALVFLLMAIAAAIPLSAAVWKVLWFIIEALTLICAVHWIIMVRYCKRKNNRLWIRLGLMKSTYT